MDSDKESIIKKKSKFRWKHFFIILFAVNILIYSSILWIILLDYLPHVWPGRSIGTAVLGLALFLVLMPLNIITVISILTFLINHHPRGKARVMSYAGLVLSSPVLIITVIYILKLLRIN
jgi:hypothetical protein